MALNKTHGNMYPWVTHTWNPLGGECSHDCDYCYMKTMKCKPVVKNKYSGDPYLVKNWKAPLSEGKTIFVQNCSDLFSEDVPDGLIEEVLSHCRRYSLNTYLFQTKNPKRFLKYRKLLPYSTILGTTIETNRQKELDIHTPNAPSIQERFEAMEKIRVTETMISIEPVMDFDLEDFSMLLSIIRPNFVSIGADSKGNRLNEPPLWKIEELTKRLEGVGIEVKQKNNLTRLSGERELND